MHELPTGTVTFLFTDIQGSARLAQDYPAEMPALLARHNAILNEAIKGHNGHVFEIVGDAFCAAFATASDTFAAALDAQRALQSEPWQPAPVSVRMGLHTGEAWVGVEVERGATYSGYLTLTRVQRVMSAAHGGQVLLSGTTAELLRGQLPAGAILRDMGEHRLKGVLNPEHLWQAVAPGARADFPPLATLDRVPTNLPVQLTSFVGRGREIAEITKLLAGARLLTLTGVGGSGKTRLSLEVAAHVIDEFPAGAWFVELAPLREGALVPQTVASTLGMAGQPGRALSDLLADYLQGKRLLLILDNCEHVVGACAELAGKLLAAAPQLQVLATSRVSLNVPGEVLYAAPPLSVPDPRHAAPLHTLTQYEAVRLFIVRAQAVKPAFAVTNENAPAVAQISQHLDGIPLAIELAAARARLLSPEQIAGRLGDRFNLLTGGSRTLLPRQQTLRATLDWSYDLLSPAERRLLNRLAVFAGSVSLDAVEAVCADTSDRDEAADSIQPSHVLDLLAALVDHSLVVPYDSPAENRYRLLETVRQYALERLQVAGELEAVQERHLAYYLAFAQRGDPHIWAGLPEWVERFEVEWDNLRAAMAAALARDPERTVLMACALSQFTFFSERCQEAYGWAKPALALAASWPTGRMKAAALWLAGELAGNAGDFERGQEPLEASLKMARELGDRELERQVLMSLGVLHWFRAELDQAEQRATEVLAMPWPQTEYLSFALWAFWILAEAAIARGDYRVAREHCDAELALLRGRNEPFASALRLWSLGRVEHIEGEHEAARACYLECERLWRQMRNQQGLLVVLERLGELELQEGDLVRARARYLEHLDLARVLSFSLASRAISLEGLAAAAGLAGEDERAARLFGALDSVHDVAVDELRRSIFAAIRGGVRARLGEDAFNAASAEGHKMTLDQALRYASPAA